MSNTVLLTGGTGFTGYYLKSALLSAGFKVMSMTSHVPTQESEVYGDLTDVKSLNILIEKVQPDYVIHLAAIAFVGHANDADFYATNVVGTINLLEAIYKNKPDIKKVILSSSANIYGNPTQSPVSESAEPQPINHYAMSKLSMEILAKSLYSGKLPILIARPFNYTGKGQSNKFIIPKIVEHFKNKAAKIELGNLDVSREFNDVRDIAHLYLSLLTTDVNTGVYNFCSSVGYELRSVLEICTRLTNHQLDIQVNPLFVRANELKTLTGDATKIKQLLPDYQFHQLEDTLKWMLFD